MLIVPACAWAWGPQDFQWRAEVNTQIASGALMRMPIVPEVLERCGQQCGALRLFTPSGTEVPYVIIEERPPATTSYTLEIKDYAQSGDESVITLALPDNALPIERLSLSIEGVDFLRAVTLEGSHSLSGPWTLISENRIYDFSSKVPLRKTHLDFLASQYKYLRLTTKTLKQEPDTEAFSLKYKDLEFTANEGQPLGHMRITAASAQVRAEDRKDYIDHKSLASMKLKRDSSTSYLVMDTTLPIDGIALQVDTPYFFRDIKLLASDKGPEGPYRQVAEGSIYRFPLFGRSETELSLAAPSSGHKHLKLIVIDNNDAPLDIRGIKLYWSRKALYFISPENAPGLVLSVGRPEVMTKPVYDIARFVSAENLRGQPWQQATPGPLVANADYKFVSGMSTKEKFERWALAAIVLGLVALIGMQLYKLLSKPKS